MDSPRGRIHALRAIEAGELELDATVASHFDTCLGCYACVTACPSGVRYDQLIEATRPKLNNAKLRSSWQISFRQLLLQVLPYPRRLRALLQPLRLYAGSQCLRRCVANGEPCQRPPPRPGGAAVGLRPTLLRSIREHGHGERASSEWV
jgi:ferredoxin